MIDLVALLLGLVIFSICRTKPDRALLLWLLISPLSYDVLRPFGANLRVVSFDRLVILGTAAALVSRGDFYRLVQDKFSKLEKACLIFIVIYFVEAIVKFPPRDAFSVCTTAFDVFAIPFYFYLFTKYLLTRNGEYDYGLEQRMGNMLAIVGFYCAAMSVFEGITMIDLLPGPGENGLRSNESGIVRTNGPFWVPEVLGQYLSWIMLFVIYRWRVRRLSGPNVNLSRSMLSAIYILLGSIGIYFVMFRNVWGGFLGGCSVRYLFTRKGRGVFLLAITVASVGFAMSWDQFSQTAVYRDRVSNLDNIYDRLGAWLYSFRAFSEHPLMGIGTRQTKFYIRDSQEHGIDLRVMDVPSTHHAHNTIIALLAENGLLGVIPFCLILWYFLREVNHCRRLASSAIDIEFGLYAMSASFAILAPGLTDRAWEWAKLNNLMFVLFAIVSAHHKTLIQSVTLTTTPTLQSVKPGGVDVMAMN